MRESMNILVEYLVQDGDNLTAALGLNLFSDADDRLSEYESIYAHDKTWMAIERKYVKIAQRLEKGIKKAHITLDEEDADEIDAVWYDGSDAYESVEEAIEELPQVYNNQIRVIIDIMAKYK